MAQYAVNNRAQSTGEREVHKEGCIYWPSDRTALGDHSSCTTAVSAARAYYTNVDGCATCSPACHTR